VHVVQFLFHLFSRPDIHVVPLPLPHPKVRVRVDRRWKSDAGKHLLAPGMAQVFFEVLQDKQCGAVFEFLHYLGWVGLRRRPDEHVEMFRHEDVPDDLESQLAPKVSQAGDPLVSETLGIVEARTSIGVLGHVMQMVEAVIVLELWHGKIISLQERLHADKTRRHV